MRDSHPPHPPPLPSVGQVNKPHVFTHDRVYDHHSTQQECMQELQPIAASVMDGGTGCVMAYGQTGSGKVPSLCHYPHM